MNFKFLLPTLSAAFFIAACGSSESNPTNNQGPGTTSKTITVLDGYINKADVFADRNSNGEADIGEFIATTDNMGRVTVSANDQQYSLIAIVDAGRSIDSDRVGTVNMSFELSAAAGSDVISPFTTLASSGIVDIAQLSSTLNISSTILTSDYIALKENSFEATIAHAFARSITMDIAKTNGDYFSVSSLASLGLIESAISNFINENGADALNDVVFTVKGNAVTHNYIYSNLDDYLASTLSWSQVSLNNSFSLTEGVQTVAFNANDRTLELFDSDGQFILTSDYLIDGTTLVTPGGVSDRFLALTHDIAISKASGIQDLTVWSKADISNTTNPMLISSDNFSGQRWFMVFDDSTDADPETLSATLDFSPLNNSPQGEVIIKEGASSTEATYYITAEQSNGNVITPLYINFSDHETPFKLIQMAESESIKVLFEMNRGVYFILTKDENLTNTLTR